MVYKLAEQFKSSQTF